MLISAKTTRRTSIFFSPKEAQLLFRQLQKLSAQNIAALKCESRKTKCWVPWTPLMQLSVKSSILVSDISDHFPITLTVNLDQVNTSGSVKSVTYKRNHSNDNITKLKQKLSEVNWCKIEMVIMLMMIMINLFLPLMIYILNIFHWKN